MPRDGVVQYRSLPSVSTRRARIEALPHLRSPPWSARRHHAVAILRPTDQQFAPFPIGVVAVVAMEVPKRA